MPSNSRPIIQSNFRNHPPSYAASMVDAFNDALSKTSPDLLSTSPTKTQDLDPVLYLPTTAANPVICCHVERGGMRFLCPASHDSAFDWETDHACHISCLWTSFLKLIPCTHLPSSAGSSPYCKSTCKTYRCPSSKNILM